MTRTREELADELERLSKLSVAGEWTFEEHLDGILSVETAEPKLYDRKDVCQIGFDRTTRLKAESFAKLVVAMRNNLPTILAALREPPEPTAEQVEAAFREGYAAGLRDTGLGDDAADGPYRDDLEKQWLGSDARAGRSRP